MPLATSHGVKTVTNCKHCSCLFTSQAQLPCRSWRMRHCARCLARLHFCLMMVG